MTEEHRVVFEGGATYPCDCRIGELHPVITVRSDTPEPHQVAG